MSVKVPPGFAEVWIRFDTASDPEPMYCSLGLGLSVGTTGTLARTNEILNVIETNLDNIVSSSYTIGGGYILWGQDGQFDLRIDSTNTPQVGDAGTAVPQNTAFLFKKNTGLGGRRNRGRFYVPGVPEGSVDEVGRLSSGALSAAAGIADDIYTTLIGLSTVDSLQLFHNSAPFDPTFLESLTVDNRVATQRRRLRR